MSEGLAWNLPFYLLGGGTIALMIFWEPIVRWLYKFAPEGAQSMARPGGMRPSPRSRATSGRVSSSPVGKR